MEEKRQHCRWKYLVCIWFGIFCSPLIMAAAQGIIKVKGYISEAQAIRQIEENSKYVFSMMRQIWMLRSVRTSTVRVR